MPGSPCALSRSWRQPVLASAQYQVDRSARSQCNRTPCVTLRLAWRDMLQLTNVVCGSLARQGVFFSAAHRQANMCDRLLSLLVKSCKSGLSRHVLMAYHLLKENQINVSVCLWVPLVASLVIARVAGTRDPEVRTDGRLRCCLGRARDDECALRSDRPVPKAGSQPSGPHAVLFSCWVRQAECHDS